MRTHPLFVFLLIGSSACSLLAPSDADLSGDWGAGGIPASGQGGNSTTGGRSNAGGRGGAQGTAKGGHAGEGLDSAGAGNVEGAQGGSGPQGGDGNDGEAGMPATERGGSTASGGASSSGTTGAGGTPSTSAGGKAAAGGAVAGLGGASVGSGGVTAANGGTVAAAGGKVGSGGATMTGAGGAVSHCSPNPCVRGTCSEAGSTYKCTCPAGWGGATCSVGSCSNMSCPSSAPCIVPTSSVVAVCYPSACRGSAGLCLAENADGSGAAIIIEGRNPDFNPLMGSNWRNRAKYFAYLDDVHGRYACVFPQLMEGGTPLVIPLNTVRTKTSGFGQSNSWPNPPTCEYP